MTLMVTDRISYTRYLQRPEGRYPLIPLTI